MVFLTIMPGTTLAALHGRYGPRMLELNVRSFLQTTGAVTAVGSQRPVSWKPSRIVFTEP